MTQLDARCCIVGGGPAGMVLAYLLARSGIDVVVLEKHADFLRDFRGDTVHPSTLDIFAQLGLLEAFLALPHQEVHELGAVVNGEAVTIADFRHLPGPCRFLAFMPQWDLLNFIVTQASAFPGFRLLRSTPVTGLIEEAGTIAGLRAESPEGPLEVRAALVVGADGRHSTVRAQAGLHVRDFGAPIDVLWMKLPKRDTDATAALGRFHAGRLMVTIDRGDYWQCGLVIAKGGYAALKSQGIAALHAAITALAPDLAGRVDTLRDWDDVSLLTVTIDRLDRWSKPGLLCIGDAAHAMSPMGGVGINLAIQDAVATANLLAGALRDGVVPPSLLTAVQERRMFPARVTQSVQLVAQELIFGSLRNDAQALPARGLPRVLRLLQVFPALRRIPGRAVGIGARPERVEIPAATA